MSNKTTSKYLSKTERERFDAMANWNTVKAAAHSLGITPQTLYNWRLEIQKRYAKRRGWINATLAQTRRGGTLTKLLHKKRKMDPPDDLLEKEKFL